MAETAQSQAVVTATVDEAQKGLQQSVPKVEVRLPGGGVYAVNGTRVKMPVGYHQVNGYVYGNQVNVGDGVQFPYCHFYLDYRGTQTDTSVPPTRPCDHVDERDNHLNIAGLTV